MINYKDNLEIYEILKNKENYSINTNKGLIFFSTIRELENFIGGLNND